MNENKEIQKVIAAGTRAMMAFYSLGMKYGMHSEDKELLTDEFIEALGKVFDMLDEMGCKELFEERIDRGDD